MMQNSVDRWRNARRALRWVRTLALLPVAAFVLACNDDAASPAESATFAVEVSGEVFHVRVEGADRVAQLDARLESGVEGVINGELRAGDGGFNAPWSWHLDPETVHTADVSIEVCDGRPSLVEADVDGWLNDVGRFCPWGARVTGRVGT